MASAKLDDDPEARPAADRAGPRGGQAGARRAARPGPRHPPAPSSTDRGLDAALSGARRPLAGAGRACDVDVDRRAAAPRSRPSPTSSSSEALTNVAKHAHADHGRRSTSRAPATGCSSSRSRDDGVGGADRRAGTGLRRPRRPGRRGRRHARPSTARPAADDVLQRGAAMRVVIAEDSVLLREGLARLLADAGIEVVAAVGDAEALLRRRRASTGPTSRVVDVRMPPTHTDEGLRAALVIRRPVPGRRACWCCRQYVEERYATDLLAGDDQRRRLPAQGPGRRRRRLPRRAAPGRRPAAPRSTPRSSPSCCVRRRATTRSTGSPRASARCSR